MVETSTVAREKAAERADLDETVAGAVDRIVTEGAPRLHRAWPDLLATGVVAGIEVTFGLVALLLVTEATGSVLLGALAFSFGFVALLLGRSELFTEGFLVPVTVAAAGRARPRDVARFWFGSAAGNLLGGFVLTWVAVQALEALHERGVAMATVYVDHGFTREAFCLAVLAGAGITMMTRMHNGTDSMPVRVFVSVFAAFLLTGLGLVHVILDTLLIFFALHTGGAPFGYGDLGGFFVFALLGNVVGGVGLVTLLRLVRDRELLAAHRRAA
ncbi:MAG: Formate efflux transporter (TC 2.A.44 family) [uncultured Actinomycetospora sp.]|uniref:Formate efflux transporter (TC 2.A.44 family) n=1 Tax=uncultured Actinomycetospora sp. TaxID=1135996 RepID=A0A6J4HL62_9PSEU|nr:MAG: Formate efflux transporter (TC 2.A.44 family) [uncultured Actinomycetospora sp.]